MSYWTLVMSAALYTVVVVAFVVCVFRFVWKAFRILRGDER